MTIKALLLPLLLKHASAPASQPSAPSSDMEPLRTEAAVFEEKHKPFPLSLSPPGTHPPSSLAPFHLGSALDSLPPGLQAAYEKLGGDGNPALKRLVESNAFSHPFLDENPKIRPDLSKTERQLQLLYLVGGNNRLSLYCRAQDDVPSIYGAWKDGWATYPHLVADLFDRGFSANPARPYALEGPKETMTAAADGFESVPAQEYTMKVGGKDVTLKWASGAWNIQDVADAIARLPSSTLGLLDTLEFHSPKNNWGGKAGRSGDILYLFENHLNANLEGLAETINHEAGHAFLRKGASSDLELFGRALPWRSAMERDRIGPSRYAATNFDEDFAEFFHLYQQAELWGFVEELRFMFPERFRTLEEKLNEHGPFPQR